MRLHNSCPPNDWRVDGTELLNDESAGDILRAIWGLLFYREGRINVYHHGGGYLKDVVLESEIPTMVLREYGRRMSRVVMLFVDLWPQYLREDERPSSTSMAETLI